MISHSFIRHQHRTLWIVLSVLMLVGLTIGSTSAQSDSPSTLGRSNGKQASSVTSKTVLPNGVTLSPTSQIAEGRAAFGWTHNANQTIEELVSVACRQDGTEYTRANSYYRTFKPSDFGANTPVMVEEVEIGIELSIPGGSTQPVTVNLYSLSGGLLTTNLLDINSADYTLPAASLVFATMPITGLVYPDETLVVEIKIPDGLDNENVFYLGANNNGESSPSYFRASTCGFPQITNLDSIGFPDVHYIINVYGQTLGVSGDSFQVLRNGDLELDKNGDKIPDAWNASNLTNDTLKTNKTGKIVSYTGQRAFFFRGGAGEGSGLKQTFKMTSLVELPGDTFDIGLAVNAINLPVGASTIINIVYNDGSKEKVTLDIPAGSYAYEVLTNPDPIVIDAGVKKVWVKISNAAASGKFYADVPQLYWNLDAPVRLEGAAEQGLVPLPAAN